MAAQLTSLRAADPPAAALAPCLDADPTARPTAATLLANPLFAVDAATAEELADNESKAVTRRRSCVLCGLGSVLHSS